MSVGSFFLANRVYIEIGDFDGFEDVRSGQIHKESFVKEDVPEDEGVKVNGDALFEHLGQLRHVHHLLSAGNAHEHVDGRRLCKGVVVGCPELDLFGELVEGGFVAASGVLESELVCGESGQFVEEGVVVGGARA